MKRTYAKREPNFPDSDSPATETTETEVEANVDTAPLYIPNPAATALQQDIVDLIRQRPAARHEILAAQSELLTAQAKVQLAQTKFTQIEQDVQYLHGQVAQLEGRDAAPSNYGSASGYAQTQGHFQPTTQAVDYGSISSVPTAQPQPRPGIPSDGVNRGHAVREVL